MAMLSDEDDEYVVNDNNVSMENSAEDEEDHADVDRNLTMVRSVSGQSLREMDFFSEVRVSSHSV